MNRDYKCTSVLAGYIEGLLHEKRSMGFRYTFEEYILKNFDDYCIRNKLAEPAFDKEFLTPWMEKCGSESSSYHYQRISFVKQLSLYMNTLGIRAYIPDVLVKKEQVIPRFLSEEEIILFFDTLDSSYPETTARYAWRYWNEYRVMFRLLYCCGMRNSEVCCLRCEDVDLAKGILTVCHSKGDKDRLVYAADDMNRLLQEYYHYICKEIGHSPYWFFPARDPGKHVFKATLCAHFNKIWEKAFTGVEGNKKATVHSLRHSYVVNKMNSWLDAGLDFDCMMPYLSKYLGHSSPSESFYYYHLNEEANRLIRAKDKTAGRILPEVDKYGK